MSCENFKISWQHFLFSLIFLFPIHTLNKTRRKRNKRRKKIRGGREIKTPSYGRKSEEWNKKSVYNNFWITKKKSPHYYALQIRVFRKWEKSEENIICFNLQALHKAHLCVCAWSVHKMYYHNKQWVHRVAFLQHKNWFFALDHISWISR